MTFQHILFSIEDGVAFLSLNRPEQLNSFNTAMHLEVREALKQVRQSSDARVLGVGLDERDSRAVPEHYVYISFQSLLYQLPLRSFGFKLADKMEHQLTATALCFVADASSGLGLNLVGDLLTKSGANVVSSRISSR